MKNSIATAILVLVGFSAEAQKKDNNLPKANEAFEAKDYVNAEAEYRIAQSQSPNQPTAVYNLGNTIYTINQPSEAKFAYLKAIKNAKNRVQKHRAFHNLGNVFMKEKDYTSAVNAYKQALINNPDDEETRYNYALAKKMLKDNPPPKDDKKDDKKDKDKNKDKDKDKNKDQKDDKGDPDKGDGQNKKDDKKPAQPKPQEGISKQRVENLLEAVENQEQKVQEKVNAKKVKGRPVKNQKDW